MSFTRVHDVKQFFHCVKGRDFACAPKQCERPLLTGPTNFEASLPQPNPLTQVGQNPTPTPKLQTTPFHSSPTVLFPPCLPKGQNRLLPDCRLSQEVAFVCFTLERTDHRLRPIRAREHCCVFLSSSVVISEGLKLCPFDSVGISSTAQQSLRHLKFLMLLNCF